jgi:ketosteroid isomerase-like protein
MSQENVEIVRRMYDRALQDPDALYELLDDNIEWETGGLGYPNPPTDRGREAVRQFFREWVGAFEEWGFEVEELSEAGNSVVACIHQWGRGKSSGVDVDARFWQVWTMRDRKAIRATHHLERTAALEAAGLRE